MITLPKVSSSLIYIFKCSFFLFFFWEWLKSGSPSSFVQRYIHSFHLHKCLTTNIAPQFLNSRSVSNCSFSYPIIFVMYNYTFFLCICAKTLSAEMIFESHSSTPELIICWILFSLFSIIFSYKLLSQVLLDSSNLAALKFLSEFLYFQRIFGNS